MRAPGSMRTLLTEDGRTLHVVQAVEKGAFVHPHVAPEPYSRRSQPHLAIQRVAVGLQILLQAADVLPVAVAHQPIQGLMHFEQLGKQIVAEVVGLPLGDVVEHLGLDDVDACVDRIGEHLAPTGFLQKALYASLFVDYHHSEFQGVCRRS